MKVKTLIAYKNNPIYVPRNEVLEIESATVESRGLVCWCLNDFVNKDEQFPVSSEFIINFCERI